MAFLCSTIVLPDTSEAVFNSFGILSFVGARRELELELLECYTFKPTSIICLNRKSADYANWRRHTAHTKA